MGDQNQFALRQIVWAKVPNYPWWPARIVKSLTQRSRKIYKVHFFGDPTYCFLQPYQLLDFESGLASSQEGSSVDLILKKSIQLAKVAYKKTKLQLSLANQQSQYSGQIQQNLLDSFEQTKLESKPIIENVEKQLNDQKKITENNVQKTEELNQFIEINIDNVIQHINGPYFQQMKASKGYNNRKQVLNLELQLKETLLAKYQLRHISKNFHHHTQTNNHLRIHRKNTTPKQKPIKKNVKKHKDINSQSARHLYKRIKSYLNYSPQNAKQATLQLLQQINDSSMGNNKKYTSLYLKTIKLLKQYQQTQNRMYSKQNSILNINIVLNIQTILSRKIQNNDMDVSIISSMMDEELKKEDEEKSKVTQIQGYSL